jgi:hypothetical protein
VEKLDESSTITSQGVDCGFVEISICVQIEAKLRQLVDVFLRQKRGVNASVMA